MPNSKKMTPEKDMAIKKDQIERTKQKILSEIEELKDAEEGTADFEKLKTLEQDLKSMTQISEEWEKLKGQIQSNRQNEVRNSGANQPSYGLYQVDNDLGQLIEKYLGEEFGVEVENNPEVELGESTEEPQEEVPEGSTEEPQEEVPGESAEEPQEEVPEESTEEPQEEVPGESAEEPQEEVPGESTEESQEEAPEENTEGQHANVPEENIDANMEDNKEEVEYLETLKKKIEDNINKLLNGKDINELTDDEMEIYLDFQNKLAEIDTFINRVNDLTDDNVISAESARIQKLSQKRREYKISDSTKVTTLSPDKKLVGTLSLTKISVGKAGIHEVIGERDELLKELITIKALLKSHTLSIDEEIIAKSLESKLNARLQKLYLNDNSKGKDSPREVSQEDPGKPVGGHEDPGKPVGGHEDPGKTGGGYDNPGYRPVPPINGPKGSEEGKKKIPRHWVEIMADTQTQSSGSIVTTFHKMGKIQPFRAGITMWAAPIKAVMKGTGKLFGDVLGRAETKKQEMIENIRGLSDEEFEILVNGLTETNMRQYKVNEIYLDAVQEVLTERENAKKQLAIETDNFLKERMAIFEDKMAKLDKELQDPAILEDDRIRLEGQKAIFAMQLKALNMCHVSQYEKQIAADKRVTDFDRGKVGKSTRKMNIQGWLAGSFNPDNRDVHQEEAGYRKEAREAEERGDTIGVLEAQRKIDELQKDNTHVIQFLEGTRFESRTRINRGKHTVEDVHVRSNDADQTKGKELIATVMAAVSYANMCQRLQANQDIQRQIDAHNQEIRSVNAHNQQFQQDVTDANAHNAQLGQDISSARSSVSVDDMRQAGINEIHRNNAATFSNAHGAEFVRTNTPGVGFNHGGSDDAIHAAQSGMTQARQAAENGGLDAVRQEVSASALRYQDSARSALTDVQGFTSIAGKAGYINSEYIANLENIAGGGTSYMDLFENVFSYIQKMGDPAQIAGNIETVSEMGQILDMNSSVMMSCLPFIAALANVSHNERKKVEMNIERQKQEQKERQAQKDAKKSQDEERTSSDEEKTDDEGR